MYEVLPDEQEGFVALAGEGVGEAVAQVQLRTHSQALAVGAIRFTSDVSLEFSDRFDLRSKRTEEIIHAAPEERVFLACDDHEQFNKRARRNTANASLFDGHGETFADRFVAEDSDDGRGVDNHIGNPYSS
jgi:hypothetical protein